MDIMESNGKEVLGFDEHSGGISNELLEAISDSIHDKTKRYNFWPVRQTRFGFKDGNCWGACASSLTGLPLDIWPVDLMDSSGDWYEKVNKILEPYGLCYIDYEYDNFPFALAHCGLYVIITGPSPRSIIGDGVKAEGDTEQINNHCVVGEITEVEEEKNEVQVVFIHDPHPDNSFIDVNGKLYIGVFAIRTRVLNSFFKNRK
jgi:hypothetical protein